MRSFSPLRPTLLSWLLAGPLALQAQIPTKCLEIERVLVDACNNACPGAQEGANEMFRFMTGPTAIPLAQLSAQWATPNNFLGWVQNASTASLTAQLNATITNCGWLVEPAGGLLPAGKRVLGITSTDMCVAGNSFANLSDTLYVIFQTPGNTFGHFKNTNNSTNITNAPTGPNSFRTFILTYLATQCSDSVTYNESLLVNQLGSYGGSWAQNDGSSLVVSWPGAPVVSYLNQGCQAPIEPLAVQITDAPAEVACGSTAMLAAMTIGNVASVFWTGGQGVFGTPTTTTTTYTLSSLETAGVVLQFCAVSICGDTICDQLQIGTYPLPLASIDTSGPTTICEGSEVLLTAIGGESYLWSTGATSAGIAATEAGEYTVTASNACGSALASLNIAVTPLPVAVVTGPSTSCPGEAFELEASGGDTYLWSTGAPDALLSIDQPGTYSVIVTDICGSDEAFITVLPGEALQPTFTVDIDQGCAPVCVTFQASPWTDVTFAWLFTDGGTAEGTSVSHCFAAGTQGATLTATPSYSAAGCPGNIALTELVNAWPLPHAQFTNTPGTTTIEQPVFQFINESQGADQWLWDFGTNAGDGSTEPAPLFQYDAVACYTVRLAVSNVHGCVDSTSAEVCVEDPFALWVPNAFSPNGDGINDLFLAVTSVREPTEYGLFIMDRWGRAVIALSEPEQSWNGEGIPDGVYVWQLRIRDTKGNIHQRTGHVVLLR